ncbi:MAG: Ig-like domain-containing protein [Gemmatimonadetes bacterium]|nr:Ig-like domain-containing protein [Gemmatimonadota bacterium]
MGSIPGLTVEVGNTESVDLTGYFSDADGDVLSYTATSSHSRVQASVSGNSVQVTAVASGTATVTVTAKDPGGLSATQTFTVTVPNRAPESVGQMPAAETFVGESVQIALAGYFSDPDGDALAYSAASSDPSVASVSVAGSTVAVEAVSQGSVVVTVTASDPGGLDATQTFQATVPNRAPEAGDPIPDMEVFVGGSEEVEVSEHFTDPDGDQLIYEARSSRTGVATVSVSGSVVTVEAVAQGTATITVTARDPEGASAQQTFEVTVPNRTPEAGDPIPDMEVFVGDEAEVDASDHFTDPDGDPLVYSASSSSPANARVSMSGSTVSVTAVSQGSADVTVTATDPGGLSATQTFEVTVPNRSPVAGDPIDDIEVFVGDEAEVDASDHFTDPDGDPLVYSASSSSPANARVSMSGSTVSVTAVSQGSADVTVTATDPGGLSATQTFAVTVPNRAPEAVGEMPDDTTFVGESVEMALRGYFSDPDGDDLYYAAASSDEGVATASASGASLTVAGVGQGTATVTVTATDPGGLSAEQSFTVTVPNRVPEVSDPIPDAEAHVGETFELTLSDHFSDPDGDDLTYAATSSDEGVATASASGASLTVAGVGQGTTTVTVTATDPGGLSVEQSFTVTVPNRVPVVSDPIPDVEVYVAESFELTLSDHFSDLDGDDLSYAATSSDERVATASASGASLTVAAVSQGTAMVTVTATDPGGLSVEESFTVTVPNRAPEVSDPIPDTAVDVGETVYVDLWGRFADPDGDDLEYSASSSDTDVATVAVSWDTVAVTGVAAGSAEVTVTASDGSLSATQAFVATIVRGEPTDREVLEILYDELGGDDWTNNENWKSTAPLEDWYGVSTDTSGRVTTLSLWDNNLDGLLPAALGDLDSLRTLSLWSNRELSGKIPPELGDLTRLKTMYIAGTGLSGEIPPELGDIKSLTSLLLFDNDLSGEIPPELGDLSGLKGLYLSGNGLTGGIPPELGKLDSVGDMSLAGNRLTGGVPPELGNMSSLWHLNLRSNHLSGPIPPELGDLSNLQNLYLDNNNLTGPIPPKLGDLSNLRDLYVYNNDLTGRPPRSWVI